MCCSFGFPKESSQHRQYPHFQAQAHYSSKFFFKIFSALIVGPQNKDSVLVPEWRNSNFARRYPHSSSHCMRKHNTKTAKVQQKDIYASVRIHLKVAYTYTYTCTDTCTPVLVSLGLSASWVQISVCENNVPF